MVAQRRSVWRKPNRLALATYSEARACSITIVTSNRLVAFDSAVWVDRCLAVLCKSSEKHDIAVLAYCFMPDHVHLLIHNEGKSSVIRFVKDFKQFTGYQYKKQTGIRLWHKSYYDHVLRRGEDVAVTANCIFRNPVRAGLVTEASSYPFSGSFEWGAPR